MGWNLRFSKKVTKQLFKLDPQQHQRMLKNRFIPKKHGDPRVLGSALDSSKSEFWRYRVGDYRILCKIDDRAKVITAMALGHRKEVYR